MPVNLHEFSFPSSTITSIWFSEEESTSIWTEFRHRRAKPPALVSLRTTHKSSNYKSSRNFISLSSSAHVSAKNTTARSCTRNTDASSWTVSWFPSPRTFQHNQLIVFDGAVEQPPPLEKKLTKGTHLSMCNASLKDVQRRKLQYGIYQAVCCLNHPHKS